MLTEGRLPIVVAKVILVSIKSATGGNDIVNRNNLKFTGLVIFKLFHVFTSLSLNIILSGLCTVVECLCKLCYG